MEAIDYTGLLPLEPPKQLRTWLRKRDKLALDVAVAQRINQAAARLVCSHCCHTWTAPVAPDSGRSGAWLKIVDNDVSIGCGGFVTCPDCGKQLRLAPWELAPRFRCSGQCRWAPGDRRIYCERGLYTTFGRIGDELTATSWLVETGITDQLELYTDMLPYEAYVFRRRTATRLVAYDKCWTAEYYRGKWMQRTSFVDALGDRPEALPPTAATLRGSVAENSQLREYLRLCRQAKCDAFPVSYLRLWQRKPQVENLFVQGVGLPFVQAFAAEANAYGARNYYGGGRLSATPMPAVIDWTQRRPSKMLGLNADELRWFRAAGCDFTDLLLYKDLRDAGDRPSMPEELPLLRLACSAAVYAQLRQLFPGPVMPHLRYLSRQHRRPGGIPVDCYYLVDYWRMASRAGADLTDRSLRYPRDLVRAHNQAQERRYALRDAQQRIQEQAEREGRAAAFAARVRTYSCLSWQHDGLLIRPPRDEDELIAEGKALSHCVANYAGFIAKGSTDILFVRKASQPDTPFFTLEFSEKDWCVRQNRGCKNCGRTEAVTAFETAWLEWLDENRRDIQAALHKKTAESAA